MCYLVTATPTAATTGIKIDYLAIFEEATEEHTPEQLARLDAERIIRTGYNNVRVWKIHATPRLEQQVVWSA